MRVAELAGSADGRIQVSRLSAAVGLSAAELGTRTESSAPSSATAVLCATGTIPAWPSAGEPW